MQGRGTGEREGVGNLLMDSSLFIVLREYCIKPYAECYCEGPGVCVIGIRGNVPSRASCCVTLELRVEVLK